MSRIHWEYGVDELHKEKIYPKSWKFTSAGVFKNVNPDFLTGTNNKIIYYKNYPYYKELFKHFEDNLKVSDLFLVVGYGFADPGVTDLTSDKGS